MNVIIIFCLLVGFVVSHPLDTSQSVPTTPATSKCRQQWPDPSDELFVVPLGNQTCTEEWCNKQCSVILFDKHECTSSGWCHCSCK
ncbi:hypothetical protein Ddc_14713 [Ditylenchus destructor]|nr:hypothetical protein Ddc_14713 [Ditylenchus destructor]